MSAYYMLIFSMGRETEGFKFFSSGKLYGSRYHRSAAAAGSGGGHRPQRLRTPKRPSAPSQIFLLTYCAGRWQSTSWLCYCLTKSRTRSPGNHHTIGITAHVDCMEHSSLDESMCFHGSGTRAGFDPRCSDSPMRRYFQCIIIQKSTLIFSGCSFGPLAQLVRATGS